MFEKEVKHIKIADRQMVMASYVCAAIHDWYDGDLGLMESYIETHPDEKWCDFQDFIERIHEIVYDRWVDPLAELWPLVHAEIMAARRKRRRKQRAAAKAAKKAKRTAKQPVKKAAAKKAARKPTKRK